MALVKYILEDNSEVTIEAQVGQNLMQLAIENNVEGIEGAHIYDDEKDES